MRLSDRWKQTATLVVLTIALGTAALAQTQEVKLAFSDPAKPGKVEVSLVHGQIIIEGYEGREVVIQARGDAIEREQRRERKGREGLRRIGGSSNGFTAEERNNVLKISASPTGEVVLRIQVPNRTSVAATCVNCDDLVVNNLEGTLELKNVNGAVKATNVAGSVVAHSLNDDVVVKLRAVDAGKAMSFSSLNGDIDVSLPPTTKADFIVDTRNGDVFTDFEVVLEPNINREEEDNRGDGGSYKVKVNRNLRGKVNGGGPVIQFKNHNGDILIRKGGA